MNIERSKTSDYKVVLDPVRKLSIQSSALFQGYKSIVIVHENEDYFLRITKNNKLLLTK